MQQTFIELKRGALITHLQTHFNNRLITYNVLLEEGDKAHLVQEEHLTTKQQYLKIIEKYPLVKDLKDRLGLQLDY